MTISNVIVKDGPIHIEEFLDIIAQMQENGFTHVDNVILVTGQGEPTVHKDILEITCVSSIKFLQAKEPVKR
jgi:repressor of nif and glnA expression